MSDEKERITIYAIKTDRKDAEEEYVLADNIDDAIRLFQRFYEDNYYRNDDKIVSVRIAFEYDVIK